MVTLDTLSEEIKELKIAVQTLKRYVEWLQKIDIRQDEAEQPKEATK